MPQFPMSPDKESYEPQSANTTQITANMPEVNISFVPASHLLSAKLRLPGLRFRFVLPQLPHRSSVKAVTPENKAASKV